MKWHRKLKTLLPLQPIEKRNRPKHRILLQLEELETRALLSVSTATPIQPATPPAKNEIVPPSTNPPATEDAHPLLKVTPEKVSAQLTSGPPAGSYTPQQIQQAYGFNQIAPVNGKTINGAGETIAIVDAYYDPDITSDANTFNSQFGLPSLTPETSLPTPTSGGPYLTVVASGGGLASSLTQDSTGGWPLETSLDVEWAHAMAPQANILLVEAPDSSNTSMFNAVQYAASQPGVVVVSMSWGINEFSGETAYDGYFQPQSSSNPNGYTTNPAVAFVAASGDTGAGAIYPAASPYVLSTGGTTLSTTTTSAGGTVYHSESAWSGSGGGPASFEGYPSYQDGQPWIAQNYDYPGTHYNVAVTNLFTGVTSYYSARMTPDVAYNADPNSGYDIYDSIPAPGYVTGTGWNSVGGTSAAAPQWSAIVALADQERAAQGATALSTSDVLNALYNTLGSSPTNSVYTSAFHDITIGSNGYPAGIGYDLATGLGTPIVNYLVPSVLANAPSGTTFSVTGSGYGGTSGFGFGGSTFSGSTFFGFAAGAQPGGGLYAGSGSLSLAPVSQGVNGLNGQTGGASVTPQANAPQTPLANSLTFTLASTNTTTAANNFVGNISTLAPASPTTAVAGSTAAAISTNAPLVQASALLGASGWKGADLSWGLSSLGLSSPQLEQLSDDPLENLDDGIDRSSGDALLTDADSSGEDWSELDLIAPAHQDDDGGEGGDGGDG